MTKHFKKILLSTCSALSAVMLAFGVGASMGSDIVSKGEGGQLPDLCQDYYFIGEQFTVPTSAEISVGEKTVNGEYLAIMKPDGNAITDLEFAFAQLGSYKLMYQYSWNGKQHIASEEFKVVEKNWVASSGGTLVTYGNVSTNELSEDSQGLTIKLAAGDTFTYQEPINLYNQDVTEIITFRSSAVEAKKTATNGVNDLEALLLEVTMTDCYDPSIFITGIVYIAPESGSGIYARTRASGQGEYGLYVDCPFNKPDIYIDGVRYGLYADSYGQAVSGFMSADYMKWSFSSETGKVYLGGGTGANYSQYMINQVTNPDISGTVFGGFTTGEVYISLTADKTYAESTTFEIEAIGGRRGQALVESGYVDIIAPIIKIDANTDNALYTKKNQACPIFPATAYDPNLLGDVKTYVYYNYGTAMQTSVLVKNGTFTPNQIGSYVIEYVAFDSFGNKKVETVTIECVEEDVITVEVDKVKNGKAGERISLPALAATSMNGEVEYTVNVTFENGDVYEVSEDDLSFLPIAVGNYTITYVYFDMMRSYEYSYQMAVSANMEYTFTDKVVLSPYYVKGVTYSIPGLNAYQFVGVEPTVIATEIFVSVDDGEYVKVENPQTFVVEGNKTLRFKYVVGDTYYETEKVEIVDVNYYGKMDMTSYFKGDFKAQKEAKHIDFTFSGTGEKSLSFITPLAWSIFSLTYAMPTVDYSSYSIILTDLADANNKVELLFLNARGVLSVSINGGVENALNGDLADGLERTLRYSQDSQTLYFANPRSSVSVPFEIDFKSEFCMMEIVLHDVQSKSVMRINRIMNQLICKDAFDDFGPQIYLRQGAGYVVQNFVGTIYAGVAVDALSTVTENNLTVTVTINGKPVTSKDGVLLKDALANRDYQVEFSQYGDYRIVYTAKDESGKESIQYYVVTVADMVAPEISFKDGSTSETVQKVKLYYKYSIKEYIVSDNYSSVEDISVYVYIYTQNGCLLHYNVEEFTLTEAGSYVVYLYCVDKDGNYATASYRLLAVENN